jgi:hypothetical protein
MDRTNTIPSEGVPSTCSQCGKDVTNGLVILLDNQFYQVHTGLCMAQFYLAHPALMERNHMTTEFLEEYIARQQ